MIRTWVVLCFGALAWGQTQIFETPLSPRIANYKIDVTLDPEHRLLDAAEQLMWTNTTEHEATELQFHLYLNAFRNNRSTFMRESGGRHRGNEISSDGWGYTNVSSIKARLLAEEESGPYWNASQWPTLGESAWSLDHEFIWPDDDNQDDKTVIRVVLPEPVPPGGSVLVDIDFEACLPSPPFARTGAKEEYFFVGQWFPKIAVFTDEGVWNCHQFHLNSEFFADYGTYDVSMTVPEANILGATGLEVSVSETGNGMKTHVYHAEDVHDFAWTTSPDFVEFKGQAQDVEIRVLMQKDRAYQGERHLIAAQHSVTYFQDWYGDYPFPNLTVIDPRRGAAGSGGMEYPTLITAGSTYGLPESLRAVELVIIHEFGHNFWYHLLASNEFEESWLDEGINTYTEIQIMADLYGEKSDSIDFPFFKIGGLDMHRNRYASGPDLDPMLRDSWSYYSGSSYGINSYSKPGVVLTTLQNYLGRETMSKVMKTYVERHSFTHPTTEDFVAIANEVSGQDLTWFFDQAIHTNRVLDYTVSFIKSTAIDEGAGFDFDITRDDLMAGLKDDDEKEESDDEDKTYRTEVRLRRLGEFQFPVVLKVVFEDGEEVMETWDGKDLWKKFFYERKSKIASAEIDPDHLIPLDINYTNNSKTLELQREPMTHMNATWLDRFQIVLDLLAL
ncbi:MAG: M1 family metallopeptidase [Acidobacteria bacterium]|nr:M1 family metallopeptidase [Acidobacteriota bacterium]